jgi:hypothetical protein
MKWDLTGERINGMYMGLWPYSGLVTESRVKYGGTVQHTVLLDEPIKAYGTVRDVVLVTDKEVNRKLDQRDAEFEGGFYDVGNMSYEDVRRAGRE